MKLMRFIIRQANQLQFEYGRFGCEIDLIHRWSGEYGGLIRLPLLISSHVCVCVF